MRALLSENRMWELFGMRPFALVPYGGADIGEVHSTIERIGDDGSYDDWHREWTDTAHRLREVADVAAGRGHRTSAREAYLRAGSYYAASYMPLYGTPVDPRLASAFDDMTTVMQAGLALSPNPVEPIEIPFGSGSLPGYYARVDGTDVRRPTIVHTNGYDSHINEMYFAHAVAANAHGYNIVLFDGPGQGRNLIRDGLTMRPDWENVVTPVIDHVLTLPGVDPDRIALAGWSFGGFLAPRAATGEHRIAALLADPGQFDQRLNVIARLPIDDDAKARFPDVDPALLDPMEEWLASADADPFLRWSLVQRAQWVHGVDSLYAYFVELLRYELSSVVERISCPTWLSAAEGDVLAGNAQLLFDALTVERKELARFTAAEGAGGHCEATARRLFHQRMYDWLDETFAAS